MTHSKFAYEFTTRAILCFGVLSASLSTFAASNILNPPDSNSRVVVGNAVVKDNQTTVLFWTYPYLGDPGSGKNCPLNYYTVTLRPGLPQAQAELVAANVCGNGLEGGLLLDNGDALIMATRHIERWRAGKRISSHPTSSLGATTGRGFDPAYGDQLFKITPPGEITVAKVLHDNNQARSAGNVWATTRLDESWNQIWTLRSGEPGQRSTIEGIWAMSKGSVLIHVSTMPADNSSFNSQHYLYFINAQGQLNQQVQLSIDDVPVVEARPNMSQAELQQMFAQLAEANPESIEHLAAMENTDGGIDVLYQRKGGAPGREGHFLLKLKPNGNVDTEYSLSGRITQHGLQDWTGFYVAGDQLVLMSKVLATQHDVKAKRNKWSQIAVSWIDLEGTSAPTSRLIPLDRRYLEVALNAGDEQMQHLGGQPGGEPALLTTLAGTPVAVSVGITDRKPALRLDEASSQLLAYTEAYDNQQASAAKKKQQAQRKADRQARKQEMNKDMAAAVGMTPEAFAALSNKERKEAMVRNGDFNAMTAAASKQAATAQMQQAAAPPGLPPELAAQLQAAMAQMQQSTKTNVNTMSPGAGAASPAAIDINPFKMPVMGAFSGSEGGFVIGGKIESGSVAVGDSICLVSTTLGKRELLVEGIELFGAAAESASTGEVASLKVTGISKAEVRKGDELRSSCNGTAP
jgi:hypothetical protein